MSAHPIQVLLVEDDADLRASLGEYLNLSGFDVTDAETLAQARHWLAGHHCDLVVIDRGLPDGDGLELAEVLRDRDQCGMVVLTARADLNNRLQGYREGVDHYMVKPVDLRELVAVLKAVGKRAAPKELEGWQLDTLQWRLTAPNGREVRLTRAERALLSALAATPGQLVPREELRKALGYPADYDPRRMEILVRRLRNKIEAETGLSHPIETVHAQGFAFTAPVELVDHGLH